MPRPKKAALVETPVAPPVVQSFTVEQLAEMLAKAQKDAGLIVSDPTVDLPTGEIPRHLIADKSALPPPESRTSAPVQPPARLWGNHSLSGPSPVSADAALIITGRPRPNPFAQLATATTQIQPTPSRYFK